MRLIDFFDDADDLAHMIELVSERIMPIVDWIDEHEDPTRKVKVSTALFIIQTYRAVTEHGLKKDRAVAIVTSLIDAIEAGEIEQFFISRDLRH